MNKETLFNKFSKNLNLVRPYFKAFRELANEYNDIIFCPLCGDILTREYLSAGGNPNALTIEHLPPESIGGKPKILLCKICNNRTGSVLDKKLLDHYNLKSFNKGNGGSYINAKGTISDGNTKVRSSFKILKDAGKTYFIPIIQDDYRAAILETIKGPISLEIEGFIPSEHFVQIAILKIGYLLAYEKLGNTFLLIGALQNIRDQIANPGKKILPCCGVIRPYDLANGIYAIYEPVDLKGLLVVFELKGEKLGVLLPPPYVEDKLFYLEVSKYYKGVEVSRLAKFTDNDFLHDKRYLWMYYNGVNERNVPVSLP